MTSPKFDEQDRKKVISDIEHHFHVSLSRVGTRRKYLEDENGKSYWVLGGYEDWHGIPSDMLEKEESRSTEGVLVVAKRYKNIIDIFAGQLQPLVSSKSSLSRTQHGDYQFNIQIKGDHLFIKEVPSLVLAKLGVSQYSDNDKDTDKKSNRRIQKLEALLNKMTPEDRERALEEMSKRLEK